MCFSPARTHIFLFLPKWQIVHEKSRHFNTNRNEIYTNTSVCLSHLCLHSANCPMDKTQTQTHTKMHQPNHCFFFAFNPDSKNALTLILLDAFVSLLSPKYKFTLLHVQLVLLTYLHMAVCCVKCAWWCNVNNWGENVRSRADHQQMHQHPQTHCNSMCVCRCTILCNIQASFNEFGITWAYFVHKKILSTLVRCCFCCCRHSCCHCRISIFQPIKKYTAKWKKYKQTSGMLRLSLVRSYVHVRLFGVMIAFTPKLSTCCSAISVKFFAASEIKTNRGLLIYPPLTFFCNVAKNFAFQSFR